MHRHTVVEFHEVDAFHGAHVDVDRGKFLGAVEAEAVDAPLSHLLWRQTREASAGPWGRPRRSQRRRRGRFGRGTAGGAWCGWWRRRRPWRRRRARRSPGNRRAIVILDLHAMFKGAGEVHGLLEGLRSLQFHVNPQGIAEAGGEEINLLPLGDIVTTCEEEQELILVLRDRSSPAEVRQLTQGIAAHRRSESSVDEVDELRPCRDAAVPVQAVVPLLGSTLHIVGRREDLLVFRRAVSTEELLALVDPPDRIIRAIILGEAKFVSRLRRRRRLLVVIATGGSGVVFVGLEAVDGDGQPALVAFEGGDFIPDRGELGQDLVHAGLEIGSGDGIAHRRGGDGGA